jgi:hypothetical protein
MRQEKNITEQKLKTWLWTRPIFFALSFFILGFLCCVIYAGIQTAFNLTTLAPMYMLFVLVFGFCVYYMIKKLPHDKMNRNDFIAIANGSSLISILTSLLTVLFLDLHGATIKQSIVKAYIFHPTAFFIAFTLIALFAVYLIGVAISGIYAKYKRAQTLGISSWKIILSMPFAFLLMWTPGYLIEGKNIKNNLGIKSKWYNKFNQWVVSNFNNILFTFLFLLFCKTILAGLPTLILSLALLIIYTLWYVKHKSDFIKNINKGYALTAVCINIAMLIAVFTVIK